VSIPDPRPPKPPPPPPLKVPMFDVAELGEIVDPKPKKEPK
jgi:hypothetical protein